MPRNATIVLALALVASTTASAQPSPEPHRVAADRLIDAALRDSAAWKRMAELTDRFGPRLAGTPALERTIDWVVEQMRREGFDTVYTQPVMVTRWQRGEESAEIVSPRRVRLAMLGLGRSVGTPRGGITAPVLVVRSFAELRARAAEARGRIVVYNQPFDTTIHPSAAYSQSVRYRGAGADSAAQFGARAVLVRSVTPVSLRTPHTGGMSYGDSTRKIPAAAISVEDAAMLQRLQDRGERPVVRLTMGAHTHGDVLSRNVVAEIRGSERPHEVVVMGGHIDSWDVGQGAMDDAGGSVAAWEALRLIRESGVRPKRTIRVVLWTAEEIGLTGARAYAATQSAAGLLGNHVLAMESDNGVFRPRGLIFAGTGDGLAFVRQLSPLLARVGAENVIAGGPQPDVGPLHREGVPALGIDTDPSKYFWYHHTEADTPDKLDPVDMARCVAVLAVLANTFANLDGRIPR